MTRRTTVRPLSVTEAEELAKPLIGMPIAYTWRGYGTAMFLECGRLRRKRGVRQKWSRRPRGEIHFMIQWSWRVEKPRSIEFGSWSTDQRINAGIASLVGPTIVGVRFEGELPELTLLLSDRRRVKTFMTERSQPAWTMFLADDSWITVERGRLVHDTKNKLKSKRRRPPERHFVTLTRTSS